MASRAEDYGVISSLFLFAFILVQFQLGNYNFGILKELF